jgi:dipeptidyl aminopeptidase/acylaminoacyl peptidase
MTERERTRINVAVAAGRCPAAVTMTSPHARRLVVRPARHGRVGHHLKETPHPMAQAVAYDVKQHVALRRVSAIAASPCGRWLAVQVQRLDLDGAKYVSDLWRVPIQCFVVKPKSAGKAPALLWIHGGPIGMDTDGWHWRWNPLLAVAQGYAVALPNPRGSTGFGQKFVDGIWGNCWGAQCYQDLMAVADALERRADLDGSRLMAMGGSFGGYMTNWIGTQTTRFKCLITHASIVGMSTFTGVTDHPSWWYLEMGGENPYTNAESFDRYAPWKYLARWQTPALVIHGELDYRCPVSEALMLFEALQFHGVASELLIFPDENHWILKPNNIVAWYSHVFDFLSRYLR